MLIDLLFDINLYGMKWQNGIYLFGSIDRATLPSTKDDVDLIEDIYCIFKELEVCSDYSSIIMVIN